MNTERRSTIDSRYTRKQFLIGSGLAAVGVFCGRIQVSTSSMKTKLIVAFIFLSLCSIQATPVNDPADAARVVEKIKRADYEGDRVGMQKGFDDLKPFLDNKSIASRVRYWRGFAQWRRAINGFNDNVDKKELERDLLCALDEFKIALEQDPTLVDAKLGTMSCNGFLLYAEPKDDPRRKEQIEQILALEKEATAMAPENPRLIWVRGPILWNSPTDRGGGQHKAMQNYEHGLEICSKAKTSDDPLEPSWGKAELMMSLAYCYLNGSTPDLNAAERYARGALELVPYWHYTRDILLPQILAAKVKTTQSTP